MTLQLTRRPRTHVFRPRFDRLFEHALTDFFAPDPRGNEEVQASSWVPAVDIRESDEALSLAMDLPGLTRDDVEIVVEDRTLTVRGERKFEKDVESGNYHRVERTYGAFSRSFSLPSNVQTDQVKARFTDGVLSLDLPKIEESKPRKIEIS